MDGMAPKTTQRKGVAQVVKSTTTRPGAPEATSYSTWKNDDLKDELRARNATVGGKKADLVTRLEDLDSQGVTSDNPLQKKAPAEKSTGTKSSGTKTTPAKTTNGGTGTGDKPAPRVVGGVEMDGPRKIHAGTKKGPKTRPSNAHETGNKNRKPSQSKSPLNKTVDGGVEKNIKTTAAEKDCANRSRDKLTSIMKGMRENHGGGTAGVLKCVFGDTYEDLLRALDNLSKIQEAELKEDLAAKKVESEVGAEEPDESEEEDEEEGEVPEESQSPDAKYDEESNSDSEED